MSIEPVSRRSGTRRRDCRLVAQMDKHRTVVIGSPETRTGKTCEHVGMRMLKRVAIADGKDGIARADSVHE